MDGGTFDRLTRALGGSISRRAGLLGALGALAGLGVAADAVAKGGQRRRKGRGGGAGPKPEGPCGNGSRKDNVCTKNSECCTGYCETRLGKKNRDRKGRCRCIRAGQQCQAGQTCCGSATCQNRVCTKASPKPSCSPAGGTCSSDDACCSGLACVDGACTSCTPAGGACTTDANCCVGLVCLSGVCGNCTASVCPTGCDFDTVTAAYAAASAGDTIYIGPGTYATTITINKSITLAACPGVTGVVLTPDYTVAPTDTYFSVLVDDTTDDTGYDVTVRNLTFEGVYPTDSYDALLRSNRQEKINWTLEDTTLKNAYYGLWAPNAATVITRGAIKDCYYGSYHGYNNLETPATLVMTDVTVSGCDSYGVYFDPWDDSSATFATVTGCTFKDNPGYGMMLGGDMGNPPAVITTVSNCSFTGNGYQGLYLYGGTATVTGCTITGNGSDGGGLFVYDADATITDTEISGNTTDNGGGIYVSAQNRTLSSLTLAGTTLVTNNTASSNGGGIYLSQVSSIVDYTITGAGTRVTGNTPDNCYRARTGTVVDCGTWT